jgi:hypothetical protein
LDGKKFLYAFWMFLKGILVVLENVLGDVFGNVFQTKVAITGFGQENAILIRDSCWLHIPSCSISRVDLEFDSRTFMEKTKIDGSYCSVVTPAEFGGPKQMRDVCFIW